MIDPEEKLNIMVIEPKCPFKRTIELPLIHHNVMSQKNPEDTIEIIDEGFGDLRERKVQTVFGDSPIKCPSGVIGNRFVNFTPGRIGFDAYLKGYFGKRGRH